MVRHLSEDFETREAVFGASMHCRVAETVRVFLSLSLPTHGLCKLSYFNGDLVCVAHFWLIMADHISMYLSITPSCMNCGLSFVA